MNHSTFMRLQKDVNVYSKMFSNQCYWYGIWKFSFRKALIKELLTKTTFLTCLLKTCA